jgi:hypothetical protein
VQVRISPVGLHLGRLREHMASADSVWRKGELQAQFAGKMVILGEQTLPLLTPCDGTSSGGGAEEQVVAWWDALSWGGEKTNGVDGTERETSLGSSRFWQTKGGEGDDASEGGFTSRSPIRTSSSLLSIECVCALKQTGVDDMDPNKGIDLKCQAIEALLRQHPELVGRVVLLQVGKACWVAGWR